VSIDPRVDEAARAALEGRLVVLPTDTVYGIGTRPDDPRATARLFEAKHRPRDLELPVLVPTFAEAERVARFDDRAERLAEAFWPGPLTLVLPRSGDSEAWDLGGERTTIGVRLPDHRLARAVLDRSGPLAVTSANVSGQSTPEGCDALVELFGDLVAVYLCQQEPLAGAPSTVIDLAHGEPRVVRHGALPQAALDAVIAETELPP
jgi:L-threonylcarbamoyladenylate synthase